LAEGFRLGEGGLNAKLAENGVLMGSVESVKSNLPKTLVLMWGVGRTHVHEAKTKNEKQKNKEESNLPEVFVCQPVLFDIYNFKRNHSHLKIDRYVAFLHLLSGYILPN